MSKFFRFVKKRDARVEKAAHATSSAGLSFLNPKKLCHAALCGVLAITFVILPTTPGVNYEAEAASGDRTLWVHYTHTGERERVTFRKNGRYVQEGLKRMNWLTRDWRRNLPTKMDPRLFDLVWSIYQESGATQPIHIVSGYRSKKTNDALRRRSRGVARVSQHTAGRAMDFFIPGVSARRLREIGLKMQEGGVGYYPGSRTPFVHMDTGRVRHWPRMTPTQLSRLFPDGKTLHTSTTGRRLPKYSQALAEYQARRNKVVQPLSRSKRTRIARNTEERRERTDTGILAGIFNRDNDRERAPKTAPTVPTRQPVLADNRSSRTAPTRPAASASTATPAPAVVAARITPPAPRALPDGARTPAAINDSAIVVAAAPAPIVRPAIDTTPEAPATPDTPATIVATLDTPAPDPAPRAGPETPAPTVVAARTDLGEDDTAPIPSRVLNEQSEGRAVVTPSGIVVTEEPTVVAASIPDAATTTAAIPVERPTIVTAAIPRERVRLADPTQLVLGGDPTQSPQTAPSTVATTLAYAAANDAAQQLPTLDADQFNERFGRFRIRGNQLTPSTIERARLNGPVFAALGPTPQVLTPNAALTGNGSLTDNNTETVGAPLALLPSSVIEAEAVQPATDINATPLLPKVEAPQTADKLDAKSNDNIPLMIVVEDIAMQKPDVEAMPDFFQAPALAFAGSFEKRTPVLQKMKQFSGTAIHPTPTRKFALSETIKLSQQSD